MRERPPKSESINLRLEKDLVAKLTVEMKKLHQTRNSVITTAITEFLERRKIVNALAEFLESRTPRSGN